LFFAPIAQLPPPPNQTQKYLLDKTAYFNAHKNDTSYPQQIESFFYDKPQYTNIMKEITNPYEKQWKTRILFEHTPRGNIIMMYDIYKMGFSYYSDQQSIPYDILNAAAMKYVVVFKCLDFFIDETYHKSPFLELYETEKIKENNMQTRIQKQNTNIKNTMKLVAAKSSDAPAPAPAPAEAITIKNRFLYQGKIMNFSFCQKISKKVAVRTKHAYSDLFESDAKHILSYKDFKTKIFQKQATSTHQEQPTFSSPPYLSSKL
jgi:hypothetical protein